MKHVFRYISREALRPGVTVKLSEPDSRHLVRVVRRGEGDGIELIDPDGRLWPATIAAVGPPVEALVADEALIGLPPAPIVLYQGLAEWGRIDTLTEKAAELGVRELVLFTSRRVRRTPTPDSWRRRRERLNRIVEAAARQAGRGHLTRVRGLMAWDSVLAEIPVGEGFLLDPRGHEPLRRTLLAAGPPPTIRLVVGPDTGLADDEVHAATSAGVVACTLGPATLRAETAALVGLGVALDACDLLNAPPREG